MTDLDALIGQTISHYRVIRKIGAGGMGVVYLARDLRLERDVAVKVLPEGVIGDPAGRKRFRNEALALARLNHPNICSVFDFDTDGDSDFLVMEFIEGAPVAAVDSLRYSPSRPPDCRSPRSGGADAAKIRRVRLRNSSTLLPSPGVQTIVSLP